MADPVFVDCPVGVWTKIATNVLSGMVHKVSSAPNLYLQTYRLTGTAAPTLETDGVITFTHGSTTEDISASVAIDVYLWPVRGNGRVRVDV